MKRVLLFIIGFFLLCEANAQKVYFSDTSNRWYAHHDITPEDPLGPTVSIDKHYFYETEVIQNGHAYRLLRQWQHGVFNNSASWMYTSDWADSALIREDTVANIVFARVYKIEGFRTNDTSEVVLYNYNLQVGDTFVMTTPSDTFRHYVSSISSVVINNIVHKRWHLVNFAPTGGLIPGLTSYNVIEGLGAMEGRLLSYNPTGAPYSQLICFRNNNVGLYPNNPSWYFNCTLGVKDVGPRNRLSVYPNPAADILTVANEHGKPFKFQLADLTGRVILEQEGKEQKMQVSLRGVSTGIYLYRIIAKDGQVEQGRLVVER